MGIKVGDLVKKLQEKDQEQVVEFAVVAAADGELVCMDIETQAYDLAQMLKMFRRTPVSGDEMCAHNVPYSESCPACNCIASDDNVPDYSI